MPELSRVGYWCCKTTLYWETKVQGSTGKEYTVSWSNQHLNPEVQYDYSCTCDAYKYGKGKYCKHILQVKKGKLHCNWHQAIDGGEPVMESGVRYCPKCGEEVTIQIWEV